MPPRNASRFTLALLAGAALLAGCGGSGQTGSLVASGSPGPTRATPLDGTGPGWPGLLHGPSHFGNAAATGPQTARIRWRRELGAAIVPGPVIAADGVAYVATNGGVLRAIDVSTGKDRWRFDGGGSYGSDLSTGPLLLAHGTVIWPGPRDSVFGLDGTGRRRWVIRAGAQPLTPVRDPANGLLIVADMAGEIGGYRLRAGSSVPVRVWSRRLAASSYGNPVVAADGTIYETAGTALYALAADGRLRWKIATPMTIEVSPAVADGGVVVFGSNDRREYGINPNGRIRWRVPIGDFTYSSPLTLPDHRVIFGNHIGQMTVLDSDTGRLITRYRAKGQLWTAAAVDDRGDAYFGSRFGHIFGFASSGRVLFDINTGSQFDDYPALAPDGTLLIGDQNGTLYAIG